jgi:hypothetical protein
MEKESVVDQGIVIVDLHMNLAGLIAPDSNPLLSYGRSPRT